MPVFYAEDRPVFEVLPGVRRQFLVSADTESSVSIVPSECQPGTGPEAHEHDDEEVFVFLEGEGEGQVGDDRVMIRPGVILVVPPNTTHWFKNTGTGPLRQIVVYPTPRYTVRGPACRR